MQGHDVIVRAFGGQPAHLVEIERSNRLAYVAAKASLGRLESGESEPIGVPLEDVFEFDEEKFNQLITLWHLSGGKAELELWKELKLYRPV